MKCYGVCTEWATGVRWDRGGCVVAVGVPVIEVKTYVAQGRRGTSITRRGIWCGRMWEIAGGDTGCGVEFDGGIQGMPRLASGKEGSQY